MVDKGRDLIVLRSSPGWVLGFVLALTAWGSQIQDEVRDPNQVFERFQALKAVDVSKATYVRLDIWGVSPRYIFPHIHSNGNAWMLSETQDAAGGRKGTFVLDGGDMVEVQWSVKRPDEVVGIRGWGRTMTQRVCGTWYPAFVQTDVDLLLECLGKWALDAPTKGRIMLFAWQLYQQGDQINAGLILKELCRKDNGQDKVLAAALNVLADARYLTAYRRFQADHDWAAYAERIKDLKARYPSGWVSVGVMDELLGRINARLSGPPPVPSDTNGLSEVDLRLAERLMGIRSVRTSSPYDNAPVLWLIPSSWPAEMAKEGDVDLEIRARGMAAIPLLLALFEDGALTEADVEGVRDYPNSSKIRLGCSIDELSRPATRGEVAQRIIQEILPSEVIGGDYMPKTGKDLCDAARSFYQRNYGATDEDLAGKFLSRRYWRANRVAIHFLLKVAKDRKIPALEFFFSDQRFLDRLFDPPESQLSRFPQDVPMAPEDCVALKEKLTVVTSREQAADLIGALSIYERVALPELLRTAPDLNARLLGLANTIVAVVADEADPAMRDKLKGWVGRAVVLDLIRDLQAYCRARCEAGQPAFCLIARKELLGGCEITVRAGDKSSGTGNGVSITGYAGLACAPEVYGTAQWRLAPMPADIWEWVRISVRTSDPEEILAFEETLAEVFGPKVEASSAALVRFYTKRSVE